MCEQDVPGFSGRGNDNKKGKRLNVYLCFSWHCPGATG
ncbi:hypothetical protein EaACW_1351 [Erwinia amylovora ACW56400]|uniref:Uncharacterized protein n=2 Tax=Erwinia amylovora TaxID=552 RepID=A0A831A431_ERWAM|nr:hypothetical protein EaACW_1351 [Erwinia amylovora ACW56400]CBA20292.1 hypothetical protein predicted by Glimmer/Critica [Erwinia amylovora CFBP1430]CCO78198.1 hypothetical protein BN432_1389 [Erwinia amylovora Ea356]CCO81986.1 hypothetical protein BN433_1403 [Erwinia amylovora Ea266]CCO85782.1 hypothetical protein BN434_1383 [Erwinia amylovora CFBP 2585]CCO89568.1 hypothetical protein BN435_1385 [Erwinia amylovora 01SFR-BO]CCO93321.1 hypothetical protein BN437_1380 [Erwinia amylovora NBRC